MRNEIEVYMNNIKMLNLRTKNDMSLIILAFVASSMTLWLLESPLKPMPYFFEVALILTMYHSLSETSRK